MSWGFSEASPPSCPWFLSALMGAASRTPPSSNSHTCDCVCAPICLSKHSFLLCCAVCVRAVLCGVQEGHCKPGEVLFGTDSHTCNAGAFGQFATGVGNTDAGFILGTGKLLIKV